MQSPTDRFSIINDTRFGIADQIDFFMDCINQEWSMPFDQLRLDSFVRAVQRVTNSEAVSVFLRDRNQPMQLACAAGVGYKSFYRDWIYWLDQPSLTNHVYTTRIAENRSADELDPKNTDVKHALPKFSGRCQSFLQGPFRNCALVPLLFRHSDASERLDTDCLGVLKLENQRERAATERFDDEAFASARVLGRFLAQILQQWQCRQLFASSARRSSESRREYLGRLAELFGKFLRAEAAAFYSAAQLPDLSHILTFETGTGYKSNHSKERFETLHSNSIISDVARSGVMCVRLDADGLATHSNDRYVKACRESVCDSHIRNLLLIPVVCGGKLLGILSAVNKIDIHAAGFGELDEQICRAFAGRIASDIEALANRKQPSSSTSGGFGLLEQHLGPSLRLKGMALRRKAAEVNRHRLRFRGQITGQACAEYLQVSRAYYLKLIKPLTTYQNVPVARALSSVSGEVSLKDTCDFQPTAPIPQ